METVDDESGCLVWTVEGEEEDKTDVAMGGLCEERFGRGGWGLENDSEECGGGDGWWRQQSSGPVRRRNSEIEDRSRCQPQPGIQRRARTKKNSILLKKTA